MNQFLMPGEWDWMKDATAADELPGPSKPDYPEDEDPKPSPSMNGNGGTSMGPLMLVGIGIAGFMVIDTLLSRRR